MKMDSARQHEALGRSHGNFSSIKPYMTSVFNVDDPTSMPSLRKQLGNSHTHGSPPGSGMSVHRELKKIEG